MRCMHDGRGRHTGDAMPRAHERRCHHERRVGEVIILGGRIFGIEFGELRSGKWDGVDRIFDGVELGHGR